MAERDDNRRDNNKRRPRAPDFIDYKDVKLLQRYINIYGQIESRRRSNLSGKQQHQLAVAIKRARHLALMPFVSE